GLVAYGLFGLLAKPKPITPRPQWGLAVGFATGAATAAISAGGPPTIVYVSLTDWPKDQAKATLVGFFTMTASLAVVGHALTGLTTTEAQCLSLLCLPSTLLGVGLGTLVYGRMSQDAFRKTLFMLLGALGVMMLARSL
ncbi:MAG: sulfite exporter TauE/SafE family protein, partial [Desulfovibrio sp.]